MILQNHEQRIVAKSIGAPPLRENPPSTPRFGGEPNLARRIGQSNAADIAGGPFLQWNFRQFRDELVIVTFIVGVLASESCRQHAGLAIERVDTDAAVFCQDPLA